MPGVSLTDHAWELAKQPVRHGGCGLQNPRVIADAAYVGAIAKVSRLAASDKCGGRREGESGERGRDQRSGSLR